VARPCVRQCRGTSSMSPSKNRALSARVWSVRVLIRVRDASEEPGSLNPTWPSVPIPRICRSTPPAAAIAASGMIDLALAEPDAANGARYAAAARATLASLMSRAYASHGANPAVLLHGTYSWHGGVTDRGLAYGDAFFLEALMRLRWLAPQGAGLTVKRARASAGDAAQAIDGLLDTAWTARGTQWLELDLGVAREAGALRIALRHGAARAARLRVVTSTDRRHWRAGVTTMTSGETAGYETLGFAPRTARYVRVWCDGTSVGRGDAIAEAEVYAAP